MNLLLVEDSAADLRLLQEAVRSGAPAGTPEMRTAKTMAEAEAALRAEPFDCVLMDLGLPDGVGVDNVRRIRAARAGQAVVVISGNDNEDTAIEALRHGAQDYLHKNEYTGKVVMRVIRRAIERNEQLRAVDRQREEEFRRATRDTLTGVSNRRLLQQLAEHTIAQSARQGWRFAVAFVDLNRFKPINLRIALVIAPDPLVEFAYPPGADILESWFDNVPLAEVFGPILDTTGVVVPGLGVLLANDLASRVADALDPATLLRRTWFPDLQ